MAGDEDREGIAAVGGAYGPGGVWVSQTVCEFAVGAGFAEGDCEKLLPDRLLKGCAPEVQWDGELVAFAGEVLPELLLCLQEDGIAGVWSELRQADAAGGIVLPEDCDEGVEAGDEFELADGGWGELEGQTGAGDRDRTGDIQLGKLTFCH